VEDVSETFEDQPQILSAQAALHALPPMSDSSVVSSKRSKKNKEPSTSSALVGVQGSLAYLGTVITSSSTVAAEQRRMDQKQCAYAILQEHDRDLPLQVKSALIEAFRMDAAVIELYITMVDDKDLRREWIRVCLSNLGLLPKDFLF